MMSSDYQFSLRIESNVYGGIRLSVVSAGKLINSASSMIPTELRQLLRYTTSQEKLRSFLLKYFDDHPTLPIQIKYRHSYLDCRWDSAVVSGDKLLFSLDDHGIRVSKIFYKNDIFVFANLFCMNTVTGVLSRYISDSKDFTHQYFDLLNDSDHESKSVKHKLKTVNKRKKIEENSLLLSPDQFNLKSSMLFDTRPKLGFEFLGSQTLSDTVYDVRYLLQVGYNENEAVVQLFPKMILNGQSFELSSDVFKQVFMETFEWSSMITTQQTRIVVRLLWNYLNASEDKRQRLLTRFLPKIVSDDVARACVLDTFLLFDTDCARYRLLYVDGAFVWVKHSFYIQFRLILMLYIFFNNHYTTKDLDKGYLIVSKSVFHQKFHLVKTYCALIGVDIDFIDQIVDVVDHEFVLDFRQTNSVELPDIYVNDQVVNEQFLEGIEQDVWSYSVNDNVSVFDAATLQKIKELLRVQRFHKEVSSQKSLTKMSASLSLLDWIQLRQIGVKVLLTDEQEALVNSFLNFESLSTVVVPESMQSLARPYQTASLHWLNFLYQYQLGGILADDMGLGKTFQTIMFLAAILKRHINPVIEKGQHLIIVPPSLVYNWDSEIKQFFPDFVTCIYAGMDRVWDDKAHIVISTYDLLRREVALFKEKLIHVLIFDEAQLLKNKLSERTKAAYELNAVFRLCLTGTPIENSLIEYYTLINLVMPNLFGTFNSYKKLLKEQHFQRIIQRSKPFVLRRLKSDILQDLPEKSEQTIVLNLSSSQESYYASFVSEVKSMIQKEKKANGNKISHVLALNLLLRLRQICISPALLDENYSEMTPKFMFLKERLTTLKAEGYSSLVFSQFTKSLDLCEQLCKEEGFQYFRLDGSTTSKKRKQIIQQFQESTQPSVFLISLKAGGIGLNLTQASYVFHMDPWWNPAVEAQATDRTHRIGQKQPVFSFRLVMQGTVEQKMIALNEKKKELFSMIFDNQHILNRSTSITSDDLSYLFDMPL